MNSISNVLNSLNFQESSSMPSGEEHQPLLSPQSERHFGTSDNFSNAPRSPLAATSYHDQEEDDHHNTSQTTRMNSYSSTRHSIPRGDGQHSHHSSNQQTNNSTRQRDPTPLADGEPLPPSAFYKMIGMRAPPEQPMLSATALEAGSGLYHDISHNHRRLKRAYRLFETIIYLALLVQTLLSTIFIVLGSVKGDYHVWIAVLGAVSAVIAGVLALTKGTGMPNRIRMERDAVWEVRRMCEALYWQVNAGKRAQYEDVEDIWKRFMDIKRNAARNHPDTWNASRGSSTAGSNSLR